MALKKKEKPTRESCISFFRKVKTCYYPSLRRFFQMRIKGTKGSVVVEAIKMVYCFAPTCKAYFWKEHVQLLCIYKRYKTEWDVQTLDLPNSVRSYALECHDIKKQTKQKKKKNDANVFVIHVTDSLRTNSDDCTWTKEWLKLTNVLTCNPTSQRKSCNVLAFQEDCEIHTIRLCLQKIIQHNTKGAILRWRKHRTRYFFNHERRNHEKKTITETKRSNGTSLNNLLRFCDSKWTIREQ